MNRRKFLGNTALSAAGMMVGGRLSDLTEEGTPLASFDLMKEVMSYRKINAHEHVYPNVDPAVLIDMADRLGMEKLVVSRVISDDSGVEATPEVFRAGNDIVLNAMKRYPDRIMGQVWVNATYGKESLEEIERCIDLGMVALKIYNQVKINNPLLFPVIERFIDLKMMILVHSHCGLGVGGMRPRYGNIQPNASTPDDFVDAAKRYPEAMFQYAHTGGGGDWEYACKAVSGYPNIYVDTSGSNNEGNIIDFALKYLGEDRLFFGTDGSYYQGVGAIISSGMNEIQRRKIFFDNFNNVLRKSGNHVN